MYVITLPGKEAEFSGRLLFKLKVASSSYGMSTAL